MEKTGVGMSADAARRSACATCDLGVVASYNMRPEMASYSMRALDGLQFLEDLLDHFERLREGQIRWFAQLEEQGKLAGAGA
jgi:hypothetical protein